MEDLYGGFFDLAGTPRLGGKVTWDSESAPRSRSDSITVMPTAYEANDAQEEPINAKPEMVQEGEILGLYSPDPQSPPTRTMKWAGQESFTWTDEPSRFFPDDACSDSSSARAEDDDGNDNSGSVSELGRSENIASGTVDETIKYHDQRSEKTADTREGQRFLTLEDSNDMARIHEMASPAIDEDEQDMLPAEHFVSVRELVNEAGTGPSFIDKAPKWTNSHNIAVIVVFVLGIFVGIGVHGYLAATTSRVSSTAVTLYWEPAVEIKAELYPAVNKPGVHSGTETQYLGRTAAASATATVGSLTSQLAPFSGQTDSKPAKAVDETDAQIPAARRMRNTREVIEEVQDAWIEVTSTASEGGPVPGLLDGPGPGTPNSVDAHGTPLTIARQAPAGGFTKPFRRLVKDNRPSFEELLHGPWV